MSPSTHTYSFLLIWKVKTYLHQSFQKLKHRPFELEKHDDIQLPDSRQVFINSPSVAFRSEPSPHIAILSLEELVVYSLL